MGKKKIFNDPLYGLISFKDEIIYDIIDEPSFQRLRRIKQMGMSEYVYSGATHPRFQHVIGATYLLNKALDSLILKGAKISEEERTASSIAILCHDMGHGPFSHALEKELVGFHHEEITLSFLHNLKRKYGGIVDMAIEIFTDKYNRNFLHQLISSQLDVDRLDYLSRDSYYTGVVEGIVGYDRIISMLSINKDNIVIEEKGVYSVEKYLMARYLMYMQVYLHKTSLVAENLLKAIIKRVKYLLRNGEKVEMNENLQIILSNEYDNSENELFIYYFSLLDDYDVWDLIKRNLKNGDKILNFLCNSLLNRKLFALYLRSDSDIDELISKIKVNFNIQSEELKYLIFQGKEIIKCYDEFEKPIIVQTKSENLHNLIETTGLESLLRRTHVKDYIIMPRT